LTPLAAQVGPLVNVFGLVFVVLAMGMSMISYSLAIFSQVDEWLSEWRPKESQAQPRSNLVASVRGIAASQAGRFAAGAAPVVLMFCVTALLLLTRQESYAAPLSFLGTLAVPLLGGIFPMLMLAASRRKGDYVPAAVFRWLGHPLVILGVYALFLASIFIHGMIIWTDPFQRFSALIAGTVVLGMTFVVVYRGAFTPRAVLEVRVERNPAEEATFSVISNGKPVPADVRLMYQDGEKSLRAATANVEEFSRLRSATFQLQLRRARELKVWAHLVTHEGSSRKIHARLHLRAGAETRQIEPDAFGGQIILPLDPLSDSPLQLQIDFS
jgi:hypothetical protein